MTVALTGQPAPTSPADGERAEFRRFVCWMPARVAKVMDTEALQTPPEVFLATHSELPMFRADLSGGDALREYDEHVFLRDFLAPPDYAFVAVLGGAGTGKSHLIRWLSTRLQATERRRVLLIPRAGTSLHEVLRRILDGIEGERFDEYRRRLHESSNAMSVAEARTRLLDNLAVAVNSTAQGSEGPLSEEEDYLASELPNLLRDPVFRSHFLQPGGVLDRLAAHVVGGGGVERIEERRAFGAADLPLRFQDVNKASVPAQEIYRNLSTNEELKHAAARWLTRHIDEAVTQLMRLSGTDLLQLMVDVRVELAQREVELVLLIEDLATLQGIDQQLLEALIIRPRQPDMPALCALRAAVAMTSGYYEGLRKNVHQRFDFRVIMGTHDTRSRASQVDLERFTARYLNATRLDPVELEAWYQRTVDTVGEPEPVPSACGQCPFQEPCHRTFGAADGMGLYPFSPVAITSISERVSPAGFNPRTQLKEGYKPALENHASALHEGRFPPAELLERLGGSRLRPIVVTELRRLDPMDHARRTALLDLWANAREVVNLDPVVHQAFDLPALSTVTTAEPAKEETADARADEIPVTPAATLQRSAAEIRLEEQLRALEEWSYGGSMSQDLMQDLREVIYAAVVAHIDWNALHLIPGEFTGSKGFRQRNSINFARQILATARAQIHLPIPLRDEDLAEAALALQGLLRFKLTRSWRFENGGKYYRAYLRQAEAWSKHVLEQVDLLREAREPWDPVPASTELLAIGARMLGRPRSRDPERADVLDAVFAEIPDRDDSERSDAWQRLVRLVRRHHGKVQDVVRARVACSKGDSRRIQMIDAARLLPVLAEVRRTLRPTQPIPSDLERTWRFLQEYREGLVSSLEETCFEERSHQVERYDVAAQLLGAEGDPPEEAAVKRRGTVTALRRAVNSAAEAGVLAGVQRAPFEEKLSEFEGVQFQAWAESIQKVRTEEDPARLLTELSLVPANTARVTTELLDLADRMLTRTEVSVRGEVNEHEREGTEELERVQLAIIAGMRSLESDMSMLAAVEEGP